jgi:hypothetical protein
MLQFILGDINFIKEVLDGILAGIFIKSDSSAVCQEFIEIGEIEL